MKSEDSVFNIIRYASRAPSGHNTQPWKFSVSENSIGILPDFSRALPVVDGDNHALYISLGCALENLIIAANHFDFEATPITESINGETRIRVNLKKVIETNETGLFDYILKRQVTRSGYTDQKVENDMLDLIRQNCQGNGVQVKIFDNEAETGNLARYIIEGSNLQFSNRAFVSELVSWCRFSEKEAMQKADGIWSASMGLPNTGRGLGSLIMKNLVTAKSEARRWEKIIKQSSGFIMFIAEKNEQANWIELGRAYQRFGLLTTKYNICHAHVNMPCEELPVREMLIRDYHLGNSVPLLLVRFGYSKPLPYSYRRNINELIVES